MLDVDEDDTINQKVSMLNESCVASRNMIGVKEIQKVYAGQVGNHEEPTLPLNSRKVMNDGIAQSNQNKNHGKNLLSNKQC